MKGLTLFTALIFYFFAGHAFGQIIEQSDTLKSDSLSTAVTPSDSVQKNNQLEKFRDAFDRLVKQTKDKAKKGPEIQKADQDPALDLGGFVLDETRSKMGRNFYSLFYQKWDAPEDAGSFTITITEKPTIGRGSLVSIKINYETVFSARLQPRYEYINALSQQAVARSKKIIKQQAFVKQQLMGY